MTSPTHAKVFQHTSVIPGTLDAMVTFHEDPRAFGRLTPPPIFVQVHERNLRALNDGVLRFTLWFGPVPVRWTAQHEPGPTPHSFADRQADGPLAYWRHEHIFEPTNEGRTVRLTDRITLAHHGGWRGVLTRLVFDGLPLRLLFVYRHLRTRLALR